MERIAVRRPCSETRSGHERIMSIPEADSDKIPRWCLLPSQGRGVQIHWRGHLQGVVCDHGGQRGGAAAGGRALDQPSSVIS